MANLLFKVSSPNKASLLLSQSAEDNSASLSHLTISEDCYNTVSHDGLKTQFSSPWGTDLRNPKTPPEPKVPTVTSIASSGENTIIPAQLPNFPDRTPIARYSLTERTDSITESADSTDQNKPTHFENDSLDHRTINTPIIESSTKSKGLRIPDQEKKTLSTIGPIGLLSKKLVKFKSAMLFDSKLLEASKNGEATIVKQLLEKGANIEAVDGNEWTPLHVASENGHEAVVQLLLKKGANIEAVDGNEWTPLYIASYNGHKAIVQLLRDNGANQQ